MAMTGLERTSPCKVNLLLNILGRRPDGFHNLETLFHPVPLCDRLVFERAASGLSLTCNLETLPTGPENLVVRAAMAFLAASGIKDGVRMHLEKHLPLAAGLGGGSGNAAATLRGLNDLFGSPLPDATLGGLAAQLGSDVPFFMQDQPALATGRGEILEPLPALKALNGIHILLVHPGFGVSTAWAYQALAKFPEAQNGRAGRARELATALQTRPLAEAVRFFYNSLEAPVLPKHPLLQLFQDFLREHGALAALMSGSGSTTFALTPTRAAAEQLAEQLKRHFSANYWTAVVELARAN
jgi:4-diphosphocytidyl-2-C-methyl-D-erythritol kinase